MRARVTVKFRPEGQFTISVIDESTGKPPTTLAEFYNEPGEVKHALQKLGLSADEIANIMFTTSICGEAIIQGVNLAKVRHLDPYLSECDQGL